MVENSTALNCNYRILFQQNPPRVQKRPLEQAKIEFFTTWSWWPKKWSSKWSLIFLATLGKMSNQNQNQDVSNEKNGNFGAKIPIHNLLLTFFGWQFKVTNLGVSPLLSRLATWPMGCFWSFRTQIRRSYRWCFRNPANHLGWFLKPYK